MAVVSDKILNWLYGVLKTEYHNVNRTYNDAATTLSNFPSITPRTEVFTYENGTCSLLLLLSGTIPVEFRGQTYRFPVALWIPHTYPNEGPMVFVTPAQGMVIRPGQHVAGDGRIYHPYLAQWSRYWDKSTMYDFVAVLRGVFAKDPPVMSQQQAQAQAQAGAQSHSTVSPIAPPRPPPPAELIRSSQGTPMSEQHDVERPPQLPPKGSSGAQTLRSPPPHFQNHQPPPLPPLPQGFRQSGTFQPVAPWQHVSPGPQHYSSPNGQRQSVEIGSSQIPSPRPVSSARMSIQLETQSPVSPMDSERYNSRQQYPHQYGDIPVKSYAGGPQYHNQQSQPGPHSAPGPTNQHANSGHPQYQSQSQQQPKPIQQPIDLLTSPLDVTLPSQTNSLDPLPAPPIPPNPEKDSLLHALSQTLVAQTNRTLESNKSAIAPLLAQQSALLTAQQTLQAELDQLAHLDSILDTNKHVLAQAMHDAEKTMRDASGRRRPEVDEILVCPTVVGSQLYALVAEQKSCEEARLCLVRALDRGRISVDVFVRQSRGAAREEFLKKALLKKVAKGMGLDEGSWRRR